ncbi:hypothetical protein TSOC_007656 [Tetrabaena socialis]|uniref:Ankyrin repeat domain-containing protein n=1 Tax=Tetrabaena socialis TaxID=47790 RepID=A0A2J8A0L6_9CHLO|nr:hypothetical protein TSOC_007656 [Tetrabaena socialis]|eukprot:PNH06045.1 hypothetical protein TSOC_007656 [Tetrabaena socialis]
MAPAQAAGSSSPDTKPTELASRSMEQQHCQQQQQPPQQQQQEEVKRQKTRPQRRGPDEPAPLGARQEAGGTFGSASDPSRVWLPELVQLFSRSLSCNEVACVLRLVNKATAAQFCGPLVRTVRLSLPAPHREFVRRWAGPDAMRSLTLHQRSQLPCLVARSGVVVNLETLLARDDLLRIHDKQVLCAAASAGQLEVCRWLQENGCCASFCACCGRRSCCGPNALVEAAKGGHQAVCNWILASSCSSCSSHFPVAAEAARHGHVGLMDWLQATSPTEQPCAVFLCAATGCDLATLQRLYTAYADRVRSELTGWFECSKLLAAAAASPTPDWRAKVEWLEACQKRPLTKVCVGLACAEVVLLPDGRARLEWLRQRGYPLTLKVAAQAASSGAVDVLQLVLDGGVALDGATARCMVARAAAGGHAAFLQALLRAPGFPAAALRSAAPDAAEAGQLRVLAWLVQALGAAAVLTAHVFESAIQPGSVELLAWLHGQGYPWDAAVLAAAAALGSEEQLEWLVAHGCPMGEEGEPYKRAVRNGRVAMLRRLSRLECPWGQRGHVFTFAVEHSRYFSRIYEPSSPLGLPALCCLLQEGCPVDWEEALAVDCCGEVGKWLREQRLQRGPPGPA